METVPNVHEDRGFHLWTMISIIEREVVDKHRWLAKDEFLDQLAVAQSLPGILAVNISVAVGDRLKGTRGAVSAALGTILPSFLIILCIAIFLTPDLIKNNPVKQYFCRHTSGGSGTDHSSGDHYGKGGAHRLAYGLDSSSCGVVDMVEMAGCVQSDHIYSAWRSGRVYAHEIFHDTSARA